MNPPGRVYFSKERTMEFTPDETDTTSPPGVVVGGFAHTDQIDQLATAMAEASKGFEGAARDTKNDFFRSKYADLRSVIAASRPSLAEHGLHLWQFPGSITDSSIELISWLTHSSGQWVRITSVMPVPAEDRGEDGRRKGANSLQLVGQAISYMRRYAWAAICGIFQEDPDAPVPAAPNKPAAAKPVKPEPKVELTDAQKLEMLVRPLAKYTNSISVVEYQRKRQVKVDTLKPAFREKFKAAIATKLEEIEQAKEE